MQRRTLARAKQRQGRDYSRIDEDVDGTLKKKEEDMHVVGQAGQDASRHRAAEKGVGKKGKRGGRSISASIREERGHKGERKCVTNQSTALPV
jgi:hypothetical protein